MPNGKVKWFNNAKGYGFIIEDGGSDDLFAHFSAIQMDGYKTLKAGQAVTFDKKPSDKGIHAVNILPADASAESAPGQSTASHEADVDYTLRQRVANN
ncbi:MAG: cold shock domain-containing protein CspD [Oleiphilaceae bacterium]|nr:cold shock domain-containing protein CspD [Oleiphilaceae bacterium]